MDNSIIKKGFKDLKGTNKDKIKVFNLILKIYNKVDSIKRSKK